MEMTSRHIAANLEGLPSLAQAQFLLELHLRC